MLTRIFTFILLLISFTSTYANLPFYPIQFPRDEAAHHMDVPYNVKNMSEWWYYNGKLTTTDGRHFGYYISFNRFQVDINNVKIALPRLEIQITDIDKQIVYGNVMMLPINTGEFSTKSLNVVFDKNNNLTKIQDKYLVNSLVKSKQGDVLKLSLRLKPTRDVLLISGDGLTDMWSDTNSYYYSQTHLITNGNITINNNTFVIDEKNSLSWMDHQWGDFIIVPGFNQWTWSSIQLDNGLEINIGKVLDPRFPQEKIVLRTGATILMPDGSHIYTKNIDIAPVLDPTHKHPLQYTVSIPEINLTLNLNSLVPDQDVNGISEGISEATGFLNGHPVKGHAFAESTVNA